MGFDLGAYDPSRTLVIDPYLVVSSQAGGGSAVDSVSAMATDSGGNLYLAGWTESKDFPIVGGRGPRSQRVEALVLKLSPSGVLLYATYIGGTGDDRALGLAVDTTGNAYVSGFTTSSDFPVASAAQPASGGGRDGFLLKLNPAGNTLIFSTYIGGGDTDNAAAVALSPSGAVWVAGDTHSLNFPTRTPYQAARGGAEDAFLARYTSSGALSYASYFGGAGRDLALAVATDAAGSPYITGTTASTNLPTRLPFQASNAGWSDAFVTKFSADGTSLVYSSYLGGSGGTAGMVESGNQILVDPAGNALVVGTTSSPDFPLVSPIQASFGGGTTDAFVARISAAGSALNFSTYFGGAGIDDGLRAALHPDGTLYFGGNTTAPDLPRVDSVQASLAGS